MPRSQSESPRSEEREAQWNPSRIEELRRPAKTTDSVTRAVFSRLENQKPTSYAAHWHLE